MVTVPANSTYHAAITPLFIVIIGNQYGMDNTWYPKAQRKQAAEHERTYATRGKHGKRRKNDAQKVTHNNN